MWHLGLTTSKSRIGKTIPAFVLLLFGALSFVKIQYGGGKSHPEVLLPAMSRGNVHELLGVVWRRDVLKSYGVEQ